MNKKFLITGGTGFIGSNIANMLVSKGYDVVIFDNNHRGNDRRINKKHKNIKVNDIGHAGGVKGHHVFINSVLGLYMDHFKGKRKKSGTSWRKDLSPQSRSEIKDIAQLDYWKQIKN